MNILVLLLVSFCSHNLFGMFRSSIKKSSHSQSIVVSPKFPLIKKQTFQPFLDYYKRNDVTINHPECNKNTIQLTNLLWDNQFHKMEELLKNKNLIFDKMALKEALTIEHENAEESLKVHNKLSNELRDYSIMSLGLFATAPAFITTILIGCLCLDNAPWGLLPIVPVTITGTGVTTFSLLVGFIGSNGVRETFLDKRYKPFQAKQLIKSLELLKQLHDQIDIQEASHSHLFLPKSFSCKNLTTKQLQLLERLEQGWRTYNPCDDEWYNIVIIHLNKEDSELFTSLPKEVQSTLHNKNCCVALCDKTINERTIEYFQELV